MMLSNGDDFESVIIEVVEEIEPSARRRTRSSPNLKKEEPKIRNLDGTEMTAEQFSKAVKKSNKLNLPVEIDGFGLVNKPYYKNKIKEQEDKNAERERKKHMFYQIYCARLLLDGADDQKDAQLKGDKLLYAALEKNLTTYESMLNEGDSEEVHERDPRDLMFSTEIDVETKRREVSPPAERFEDRLNKAYEQKNSIASQFESKETSKFHGVLKRLVKTESDAVNMEQTILAKIKKQQLSRGWVRVSGVKLAPMKIIYTS